VNEVSGSSKKKINQAHIAVNIGQKCIKTSTKIAYFHRSILRSFSFPSIVVCIPTSPALCEMLPDFWTGKYQFLFLLITMLLPSSHHSKYHLVPCILKIDAVFPCCNISPTLSWFPLALSSSLYPSSTHIPTCSS